MIKREAAASMGTLQPDPDTEPGPSKKQKTESAADEDLKRFYRSWAWKREHRPDKDRFHRPYQHPFTLPGSATDTKLIIKQQKFGPEGFASTVWDSSIVMAKYVEKWQHQFCGKRCLDLSAGCGLVAVVMAKVGGHVTATDLEQNLALLRENCTGNGVPEVHVCEHGWGSEQVEQLQPPFDIITACDVMYIEESIPDLVKSLVLLSGPGTMIYISHGRNRSAEPFFRKTAAQNFAIEGVPDSDLDEVYQCSDVDMLKLIPIHPQHMGLEQAVGNAKSHLT